jgi:uncharacterized Zn finger protein
MSLEETLANNSNMLGEILGAMKHLQSLQERGFEGHLRLVETVERISLKQDQRMTELEGLQERSFEAHLRLVETVERISLKQDQRMTELEGTAIRLSAEQDAKLTRLEGVVERLARLVEAFVRASGDGQASPEK